MSFVISGLSSEQFRDLLQQDALALANRGVIVKAADCKPGYPCRITLEDAEIGEDVLLLNYESHRAATPYRSAYAIYVRRRATETAHYRNELPPVLRNRPIALRIFDNAGMLIGADMGVNGDLTAKIDAALAMKDAAYLHAHNAMHGCFAAEVRRA